MAVVEGKQSVVNEKPCVVDTKPSLKGVMRIQPWRDNYLASHSEREDARCPGENGTSLKQSPIVNCYKWL
jgi:hypothetical protein